MTARVLQADPGPHSVPIDIYDEETTLEVLEAVSGQR